MSLPLAWFDNRIGADFMRLLTCLDGVEGKGNDEAIVAATDHKVARTSQAADTFFAMTQCYDCLSDAGKKNQASHDEVR